LRHGESSTPSKAKGNNDSKEVQRHMNLTGTALGKHFPCIMKFEGNLIGEVSSRALTVLDSREKKKKPFARRSTAMKLSAFPQSSWLRSSRIVCDKPSSIDFH
jgi:hypothetical protein